MKIFNAEQIRRADKVTIENQHISSLQLMERAGYRLFRKLHENYIPLKGKVWVFCGMGNNGGDGLVIARHLYEAKQEVVVVLVNFSDRRSEDMQANLDRVAALDIAITEFRETSSFPEIIADDLVIDAVFGIGLSRRPAAWVERLILNINTCPARVVAVDLPSGMMMDGIEGETAAVIKADHTYTFQTPKLPLLLPGSGKYSRNWSIIAIDQDPDFLASEPTFFYYTDEKEMVKLLEERPRFSHKGSYGHAFICGGSYGKVGAALMCAEAALTAGSGLVSALVPRCGYQVLQTSVPEVMCVPTSDEDLITGIQPEFTPDTVALGPGMGKDEQTFRAVMEFLNTYHGYLVLDADGLNILAEHPEMWDALPGQTVITPHPGEFKRLVGAWKDDNECLEMAMQLAKRRNVIVVLKGAYTLVTDGDGVYFNSTGNPGMATGGSGDVLTGIIASLLGQDYAPLEATRLGVFLHGLSADIAIRDTSVWALKATDIIDYLGDAFLFLQSLKR
ncbi:NAD(P)H-hydrate dehydratase [Robertkochia marina]|uniref:Bifunctional NAD(P)H-hydrate repair enzyme n=1 Tax=Robertkochia marina TaxID=1227945 RepID=A0A4V3UY16_9FLAO|nr:NAD(P)H-hydrate dehydratase [Robertkochia marina]THD66694.1 NAD(P)H-hydrate dehydratase [Robertkochia marina]TRZ45468.1 NAD(P)H-hydrate dehydratase [Robertkochia marina]